MPAHANLSIVAGISAIIFIGGTQVIGGALTIGGMVAFYRFGSHFRPAFHVCRPEYSIAAGRGRRLWTSGFWVRATRLRSPEHKGSYAFAGKENYGIQCGRKEIR